MAYDNIEDSPDDHDTRPIGFRGIAQLSKRVDASDARHVQHEQKVQREIGRLEGIREADNSALSSLKDAVLLGVAELKTQHKDRLRDAGIALVLLTLVALGVFGNIVVMALRMYGLIGK